MSELHRPGAHRSRMCPLTLVARCARRWIAFATQTLAFQSTCEKAMDAERAAQRPASAEPEPSAKRLFVEVFHVTKDWSPSSKDSAVLTYLPILKGEVLHGMPGDAPTGWTRVKRLAGGDAGIGHVPTARLRAAPASLPAAAPPQELSDDDDEEESEDGALDEEEQVSLDEVQKKVDFLFNEDAETEFEAGELADDFDGKHSEAQVEEALQNLCKNGPPPAGGLRIISASIAGRQVYKKAPAPAAAAAAAVAMLQPAPPSEQQLYDHIKLLCAEHKADHDYTLKKVRLCPSRASDATMPLPPHLTPAPTTSPLLTI